MTGSWRQNGKKSNDSRDIETGELKIFFRRRYPKHPGGFLLDGGIHFVAGLRALLAGASERIQNVAAFTSQLDPRTPPCDTVHAVFQTDKGAAGTFSMSFMTEFKGGFEFEIITENGSVIFTPLGVEVTTKDENGEKKTERTDYTFSYGIDIVVALFAKGVSEGKLAEAFSLDEAMADLEVVEALLKSEGQLRSFS